MNLSDEKRIEGEWMNIQGKKIRPLGHVIHHVRKRTSNYE